LISVFYRKWVIAYTPEIACRFVQTSRQEKDGTWSELTWFETTVLGVIRSNKVILRFSKFVVCGFSLFTSLWWIEKINAQKLCHNCTKRIHKLHKTKTKYNQMFMIIEIIEESLGWRTFIAKYCAYENVFFLFFLFFFFWLRN
jgi:hypothetical protein